MPLSCPKDGVPLKVNQMNLFIGRSLSIQKEVARPHGV